MIIHLNHNNFSIKRKPGSKQGLCYFKVKRGLFSRNSVGPIEQALLKIGKEVLKQINSNYPSIWTQL